MGLVTTIFSRTTVKILLSIVRLVWWLAKAMCLEETVKPIRWA
uniref:Uncharacterized protein n=1 Tax=Brassica campestris TaxID=3711 RepID=A0A3P6AJQ6_BRACM|nr:unnamed protein product [Brassica rapa]